MASTSGSSKKRSSSPLDASPGAPSRKAKRSATSPENSFSSEEFDSGVETFIVDDSSLGEPSSISPKQSKTKDSDDLQEFLCSEMKCSEEDDEEELYLCDAPIVINMDQKRAVSAGKTYLISSSTKENRANVKMDTDSWVVGESLIKLPKEPAIVSLPSPDGLFRVRDHSRTPDGKYRGREDPLNLRVNECPFADKANWPGYRRDPELFSYHPFLEPVMRSMLLEWMMEVSKAHSLQRKTYHMALDYVDRFLSFTENLPKAILQLLGVSALNIAAKIEEIFPPKLSEMAWVTDSAHDEAEIKSMEKIILNVLGTAFMPVTPSEWAAIFMQEAGMTGIRNDDSESGRRITKICVENQLPIKLYSKICRLIDLAMLDEKSLEFTYRQLSAAAIFLSDRDSETRSLSQSLIACTKGETKSIHDCIQWMQVYADIEQTIPNLRASAKVPQLQTPHLQTHDISMEIYSRAKDMQQMYPLTEQNQNLNNDLQLLQLEEEDEEICEVSVIGYTTPQRAPKKNSLMQQQQSSVFITPPDSQGKKRTQQ